MVNQPTLKIEEYIPDAEAEFAWRYYTPYGLSMKVRLNDSGRSKYYSKFAIEFENTGGYEMQTLPVSWRRCEDGSTEDCALAVPPPSDKMLLFFEGEYEKNDFVQAILRLALFFKLQGYKITKTWEDEND